MVNSWGSSWGSSWGASWGSDGSATGTGTPVLAIQTASGSGGVSYSGSGGVTIPAITASGTDGEFVGTDYGTELYRKTYDEWKDESGLSVLYNINDHAYSVLTTKTALGYDLQLDDLMKYYLINNKGITGPDDLNDLLALWDLTW
jgi:hypothetical protein